jgi:hypothetical protein
VKHRAFCCRALANRTLIFCLPVRQPGSNIALRSALEQFNPEKTIELKASDTLSMHRVVGSGEA